MPDLQHRYDLFWSTFTADVLKKMSTIWGAPNKLPKEERIAYLTAAPRDPHQVDAAIERMQPFERAALSILRGMGGTAPIAALAIAVRTTGLTPDTERFRRDFGVDPVADALLEHGIVMFEGGHRYYSSSFYSENKTVFTDERILDRLPTQEYRPFAVSVTDAPTVSTARRVPSVVLEVISMLRAIDALGGIGLTKAGVPRTNDLRKLARKQGWEETIRVDGLPFFQPAVAYLHAMARGGLLRVKEEKLVNVSSTEAIAQASPTELLGKLLNGLILADEWMEVEQPYVFHSLKDGAVATRTAVLTALRCLPDRTAWVRFADFERALFARIGAFHSVHGTVRRRPSFYRESKEEQAAALIKWQEEIQRNWEQYDIPWLQALLQSWLYAFGMVELHLVDGEVERFRLTDLGRALLSGEPIPEHAADAETGASAWIVQPNFDVVVYLEHASTQQIAFLEQYAERLQVAQHTAQYRLTRDSVYEGLQRGDLDQLLTGLAAGSHIPLPGNVQAEIKNWALLRERITVRRHAELIEFTDAVERQAALAEGVQGLPVGERFLLLSANTPSPRITAEVIDYLVPSDLGMLILTEEGTIRPGKARIDLVTKGLLDLWCEREAEGHWRLTRESVERMLQRGRKLSELQTFLKERSKAPLPPLLQIALRAWAGSPTQAGLSTVVLFQCSSPAVLEAVLESKALKPHLVGRIGPEAILVRSAGVQAVQAVLDWAGVEYKE